MGPAVLAGLPAAVLGQEAPTGEVTGEGCCQDLSVIQWEGKFSLDAWDPGLEWLEAMEAGRRLWF